VDPDGAAKRRQHAEREQARVAFWRDNGGACALAAFGLPTDAALAANDAINTRAQAYKAAKIRPDAKMDQLRVLAFLDILNGITLPARITADRAAQAQDCGDGGQDPAPACGPASGRGGTGQDRGAGSRSGRDGDASTSGSTGDGAGAGPGGTRPADDGSAQAGDGGRDTGSGDVSTSHGDAAGRTGDHAGDGSTSGGAGAGAGGTRPADDGSAPGGDGGRDTGSGDASTTPGADPAGTSDGAGDGSTSGGPGSSQPGGPAAAPVLPALTARSNLTLPLATLLQLAERPGTAHGLGPLDPALVRDLAAAAAGSPHSEWCTTITDSQGTAVAHGCARPARTRNKTGTASRDGPPGWAFTPTSDPGPPGGYGTWTLTLPGGRAYTVKLEPVPVTDCDHRHESHGYQPGDTLRHLVQVRDGECTFPPCSRHARESDFEHAVPYDKGGRTCACNGGARSRRCHRVKQSPGWSVTQPQPGWHRWTTPSGRTYTQGPMQYPA